MAMNLGSIVATLKLNIDDYSKKLKVAEEQLKTTESKFSGFTDIGNRISGVGKSMTLGVTAPIVTLGATCSKFFMDFETGMAKVSTVADTAQVPISTLSKQVMALSNSSGLGTSDLVAGLYDVISAGVSTKDSMNYLTVAVKAAKGGFTDTATAVDGLTSVLNAYGLKASEANKIANQMMVAQNLGKTTFGEMAQVMGNVAPTASALKVKTTELFSAMAVLTANGIKTSESVTGLKAAFANIIKPSTEAQKAAKALGINFDANAVSAKGLMPFLTDIKDKIAKVAPEYTKCVQAGANMKTQMTALEKAGKTGSDQYKDLSKSYKDNQGKVEALANANKGTLSGYASLFGSVEGLNSVLTLTSNQGVSLYSESMKQMGDGTDRVDQAFKKMSETSGDKLKRSLNQLKNAGTELGASLTGVISKLSDAIGGLAKWLNGLTPAQQGVLVKFLELMAVIGPLLWGLGSMMKSVVDIKNGFTMLKNGINLMKNSTLISTIATKLATAAQWLWNAALNANPIGLVVIAIGLLVGAFIILWNKSESFRNFWKGLWADIKNITGVVVDAIVGFFTKTIPAAWDNVINAIKGFPTWLNGIFNSAKTGAINGLNSMKAGIQNILSGIGNLFKNIFTGAKNVVLNIVRAIASGLTSRFTNMVKAGQGIFTSFKNFLGNIFQMIKLVVLGPVLILCDLLTGNFGKLKSDVIKIITSFKNSFLGAFTALGTMWKQIVTALVKDVIQMFFNFKNNVYNLCVQVKSGIISVWSGIKAWLSNAVTSIKNGAINGFTNLKNGAINIVSGMGTAIRNTFNKVVSFFRGLPSTLRSAGYSMFNSLKSGMSSVLSGLGSWISSRVRSAINTLRSFPSTMSSWGRDMIQGLINGIKSKIGAVGSAVSGIANKIRRFLHFSKPDEGPLAEYEKWTPDMMEGMAKGITANKSKLINSLKNLTKDMSTELKVQARTSDAKSLAGLKETTKEEKKVYINFNGNYGFKDKGDIDYFMNRAALLIKGDR